MTYLPDVSRGDAPDCAAITAEKQTGERLAQASEDGIVSLRAELGTCHMTLASGVSTLLAANHVLRVGSWMTGAMMSCLR
jgi:hypothetical protein